jgi:hypothetical protein
MRSKSTQARCMSDVLAAATIKVCKHARNEPSCAALSVRTFRLLLRFGRHRHRSGMVSSLRLLRRITRRIRAGDVRCRRGIVCCSSSRTDGACRVAAIIAPFWRHGVRLVVLCTTLTLAGMQLCTCACSCAIRADCVQHLCVGQSQHLLLPFLHVHPTERTEIDRRVAAIECARRWRRNRGGTDREDRGANTARRETRDMRRRRRYERGVNATTCR